MVRVKQQIDVIQCPKYSTEYGTQNQACRLKVDLAK
jgi:hypothetical protein